MAEIFNNPFKTTQSWSSQGAVILYGTGDPTQTPDDSNMEAIPLLVSGLSLTYTQQATPVFPLNTDINGGASKINIKGAPQGTLQLQSIYSPVAENIDTFLEMAARQCVGPTNQMIMTIRPFGNIECVYGDAVTNDDLFRLTGVELISLGLNIQAGEVTLVNMPLQFTFTSLSKELFTRPMSDYAQRKLAGENVTV